MSKRFGKFINRKGVYIPSWAFEANFRIISDDNLTWY